MRLESDQLRSRRGRTLETPDDREADEMRVSRQRAVETPVHRETRLEAEKNRFRKKDVHEESGENKSIINMNKKRHHNNNN